MCLYNDDSAIANENLLQTNGTTTVGPNSCSYADIAIDSLDFLEIVYFGRHIDDYLVRQDATDKKPNELYSFIIRLNPDLKYTMEIVSHYKCVLDFRISIFGNKLTTSVYSKQQIPINIFTQIPTIKFNSSVKGIEKDFALRLRLVVVVIIIIQQSQKNTLSAW